MLIGVVGFAGSGKGTFADILVSDYGFKKISFADTLKDAVSVVFDWPRDLLEGDTQASREFRERIDPWWTEKFGWDVTPRQMLRLMGTEAGRDVFDKNIWVHALAAKAKNYENVVVPDVRFRNEVAFIKESKGFTVRVKRGPEPDWYDTALQTNLYDTDEMNKMHPDIHISEWDWVGTKFDSLINNDGSLDALRALVSYQMKVFIGPKETGQRTLVKGIIQNEAV